jgi:folylpolyglutamate synthase/dihydrofolate synthase
VYFFQRAVDVMILECGIGGRLDSTNIVRANASVLASIALDHEEILGDTLQSIAREKAGIIKPAAKVFTGDIPECAEAVVENVSRKNQAQMVKSSEMGEFFEPNLRGDFQRKNAKLAHGVLKNLPEILPMPDGAIEYRFATAFGPARNQIVSLKNGNEITFDGAHNWEAVNAQKDDIARTTNKDATTLIFGSTKIRQCESCFAILEPLFHRVLVTNISDGSRKLPDNVLIDFAGTCASKCRFLAIKACAELLMQPTDEVYWFPVPCC